MRRIALVLSLVGALMLASTPVTSAVSRSKGGGPTSLSVTALVCYDGAGIHVLVNWSGGRASGGSVSVDGWPVGSGLEQQVIHVDWAVKSTRAGSYRLDYPDDGTGYSTTTWTLLSGRKTVASGVIRSWEWVSADLHFDGVCPGG